MSKSDEKHRDEVLKRMLSTPKETNKDMVERRTAARKKKARDSLKK